MRITSVTLELYFEKGNTMKFTSLVRELESAGTLSQSRVSLSILLTVSFPTCNI